MVTPRTCLTCLTRPAARSPTRVPRLGASFCRTQRGSRFLASLGMTRHVGSDEGLAPCLERHAALSAGQAFAGRMGEKDCAGPSRGKQKAGLIGSSLNLSGSLRSLPLFPCRFAPIHCYTVGTCLPDLWAVTRQRSEGTGVCAASG